MRIQPRQQVLEIWRAVAGHSYQHEKWTWGGRDGSNSISDAEQLLCIMLPSTELARFRLDQPNETDGELVDALRPFGGALEIPQVMVGVMIDYLRRYSAEDGTPVFSGGSYVAPLDEAAGITPQQERLDVVESFAVSVTLALAALGFAKVFRSVVNRHELRAQIDTLEELASWRLSAAMVGLLRSFTVNVFTVDSEFGHSLLRTVNQSNQPVRRIVSELQLALRDTAVRIRDLDASNERVSDLDNPERLFECGWSWGVTKGAPRVETVDNAGEQRDGYAQNYPYLYFTVVALDAISELFSQRTRVLGLLDDNQLRLAAALQVRWDLTQRYWSTIASFGVGRWPLEDIPWRTTDGIESDYFTLLVTSIAANELAQRRDTDPDLIRVGYVLIELANRGRMTRRPVLKDSAVGLHHPGVMIELQGADDLGPPLGWLASAFAPLVLRRTLRIAGLISDINLRAQMVDLADEVWVHVRDRRMQGGSADALWDQPHRVFPEIEVAYDLPCWRHTVRVVESLVMAAELIDSYPLHSDALATMARDLLAEAEHLFDQELLAGSASSGRSMRDRIESVRQSLRRSRELLYDRPGTAVALLMRVLQDLDNLAAARQDVFRPY